MNHEDADVFQQGGNDLQRHIPGEVRNMMYSHMEDKDLLSVAQTSAALRDEIRGLLHQRGVERFSTFKVLLIRRHGDDRDAFEQLAAEKGYEPWHKLGTSLDFQATRTEGYLPSIGIYVDTLYIGISSRWQGFQLDLGAFLTIMDLLSLTTPRKVYFESLGNSDEESDHVYQAIGFGDKSGDAESFRELQRKIENITAEHDLDDSPNICIFLGPYFLPPQFEQLRQIIEANANLLHTTETHVFLYRVGTSVAFRQTLSWDFVHDNRKLYFMHKSGR